MNLPCSLNLADHAPGLAEAQANLAALIARRHEITQALARPRGARGTDRAGTLVVGEEAAAPLTITGPPPLGDDERNALYREQEDIARAIPRQENVISRLHETASRTMCDALRPAYTEIVRAIVTAIPKFAALVQREHDFRNALSESGASFVGNLPPVALRSTAFLLPDSGDPNATDFLRCIREAWENGYISTADVRKLGAYPMLEHLDPNRTPSIGQREAQLAGVGA